MLNHAKMVSGTKLKVNMNLTVRVFTHLEKRREKFIE